MRKPRSALAAFLSFNRHRKRFGAGAVGKSLQNMDFEVLKNKIIDEGPAQLTHGSKKELQAHIDDLRREFSGSSELVYYHAKLIVLIRREADSSKYFDDFSALWNRERDYLLKQLSLRWLISAADTFIDHSPDSLLRAVLMNAVVMVNTVKLQESERFLCAADTIEPVPERRAYLQEQRLALFDGVAGFAVGTDDTLRNMRWRLDAICSTHPMGKLVIEVFERLQKEGNVFARFKQLHTREKTAWWND